MKKLRSRALAMFSALAFATSSTLVFASEPGNNTFPFGTGQITADVEALISNGLGFGNYSLSSTTDVDYILVSCDPRISAAGFPQPIDYIKLNGLSSDFDLYVYLPSSPTPIASGQNGGTAPENVSMSAFDLTYAIVKVVRYSGAAGNYTLGVVCG